MRPTKLEKKLKGCRILRCENHRRNKFEAEDKKFGYFEMPIWHLSEY